MKKRFETCDDAIEFLNKNTKVQCDVKDKTFRHDGMLSLKATGALDFLKKNGYTNMSQKVGNWNVYVK